MAHHLTLSKAVPVPSTQLRIVWQGFRVGDTAAASWADDSGPHLWRADANLSWLQRDSYATGEEWKINLGGAPAGVDSITLLLTSTTPRTVGVAVLPLAGDPEDGMVHPGTELIADLGCELLHLHRIGGHWNVTATNSAHDEVVPAPTPNRVGPFHAGAGGQAGSGSAEAAGIDTGRQIPIPAHLQPAVDKIRAAGAAVRRVQVGAVVDISASMRPWLASGLLADTLSAVLAVAGASSRPSASLRFAPGGAALDLPLEAAPNDAVIEEIGRRGLCTGSSLEMAAAIEQAAGRGGVVFVISDGPSVREPAAGSTLTVLLGGPQRAPIRVARATIAVGSGTVDVGALARELALAARDVDPR